MFQEERLLEIKKILQEKKRISIEDICETFTVSRDTARRDLVKLDEQGHIIRTRGGALLPTNQLPVQTYEDRLLAQKTLKDKIGKAATQLIRDGEQVLLDSSTTVQSMIHYWQSTYNKIVTNSVDIASIVTNTYQAEVHILGGVIHPKQRFIYGAKALEQLSQLHFHKLFLGACGVSQIGLSNPYEEEATLLRTMIKQSEQIIVLADHKKFHQQLFHHVCPLESIDIIITDQVPDSVYQELLHDLDIQLIITKGDE
ncbi:DeoR/GlpR family DNA-binding transcription regulator [Bacillus pinisoli]|uniref:DeoR/GlpR family DNA-binding transcription regulator n=1 Tax=Bacillus pinisoli TaxID=2901866 RepID=UPI001FF2779A|nr:DeoR/GlpR family DNA-binding transcription regulator [Bacillus pinisoli]